MAIFLSDLAFDITKLNLNSVYSQPREFGFQIVEPLTFSPPPLPFGRGSVTIPAITVAPGTVLGVVAGQETLLIGGSNIATNPLGEAVGGTVTIIGNSVAGQVQFLLAGLNLSANSLSLATSSPSTEDDRLLFYAAFVRNDFIVLSTGKDRIEAGEGKDLIIDQGGFDTIFGGYGDDVVMGGKGEDRLEGGDGNDLLLGEAGADRIVAGEGSDVIWAGAGNDTSSGGAGRDSFVFRAGDGVDHITSFSSASDQILFAGPASGLDNLRMVQKGADLKITFADVTVFLDDTLLSEVSRDDISLGGNSVLQATGHAFFDGWTYG